ncbi:hypothetical protein ABG768_027816 [Culter alburnus]|uniref:Transmembrane protein FAM155A n=1 Tax=Culter alburnus TaxID=194366 RepID=A0AAW2AAM4_CULAL
MTRGAWTCRQQDDGLKICFAPREDEKPLFTDSERAQRWRLSLASLLFITVLLSDHLWFCAEAKLTRTRDKRMEHTNHILSSSHQREQSLIFIGNSTKPLWRLETCHPDSLSKNCWTFGEAEAVCSGLSEWNLSDFYLSFCNSYSLLDLFHGFRSPDNLTCNLDMADASGCSQCVQAYQRYDRRAQEKYREFELLVQKYETDVYSVRTCMEECTVGVRCLSLCSCILASYLFHIKRMKKAPHVYAPLFCHMRARTRADTRCARTSISRCLSSYFMCCGLRKQGQNVLPNLPKDTLESTLHTVSVSVQQIVASLSSCFFFSFSRYSLFLCILYL